MAQTHRQRIAQRLARRWRRGNTSPTIVDRLVEATSGMSLADTKHYIHTHYERIGSGDEADVYALNEDIVVKVSNRENLRGEYVIFADPQYDLVTPEVYGHDPDWHWIAVERVDSLRTQAPADAIERVACVMGPNRVVKR